MRFQSAAVILAIGLVSCSDRDTVAVSTPATQLEEFYSGRVRLGAAIANVATRDSSMAFQPYRGYAAVLQSSQHGLALVQLVTGESLQPEAPPAQSATVSAVLLSGDSVNTRAVAARANEAFGVSGGETECRELSGIGRFRISKWTSPRGSAALIYPEQAGSHANARFVLTTSFEAVSGVKALLQPGRVVPCDP